MPSGIPFTGDGQNRADHLRAILDARNPLTPHQGFPRRLLLVIFLLARRLPPIFISLFSTSHILRNMSPHSSSVIVFHSRFQLWRSGKNDSTAPSNKGVWIWISLIYHSRDSWSKERVVYFIFNKWVKTTKHLSEKCTQYA